MREGGRREMVREGLRERMRERERERESAGKRREVDRERVG